LSRCGGSDGETEERGEGDEPARQEVERLEVSSEQ
jgi:hypothetical protein